MHFAGRSLMCRSCSVMKIKTIFDDMMRSTTTIVVQLLVLHQKPPRRPPQSRVLLVPLPCPFAAVVPPSSIGRRFLGFAAFSRNFNKKKKSALLLVPATGTSTDDNEKLILRQREELRRTFSSVVVPIVSLLLSKSTELSSSSSSPCVIKKNWLLLLVTLEQAARRSDYYYSSVEKEKKEERENAGTGGKDNYLVDFDSFRSCSHNHHHHGPYQLGHIPNHSPLVTFRSVASSFFCCLSNPICGVNRVKEKNKTIYSSSSFTPYITINPSSPFCPIRTFTASSKSSAFKNPDPHQNNINMSTDLGDKQIADGNIQDMRKPYRQNSDTFDLEDLASRDPITQFSSWFQEACKQPDIKEPNAIALATASRSGQPSVRMVLLKGFGKDGFKIYTNFDSRKGKELMENPLCSICIHWEPLNRSVRIEGKVIRLSEEESTNYFNARPRSSQLGAIVSNQSTIIPSRQFLMDKYAELEEKYGDEEVIPKPDFWGGYLIKPDVIEFWQGQTTRVHDRLRFRKKEIDEVIDPELTHEGEDGWVIERLSP